MNCAFLQTLRSNVLLLLVGVALFLAPLSVSAQFNPEINYQGKLTDSTGMAVPDGTYNMNFWLVPTSGGATSTAVWSEVRTGGNQVQVVNGLFSVMLGDVSTLVGVDFDQVLYLAVEIGGTGSPSWDGELLPRKILGAVPVAFYADTAGTAELANDSELLGGVASSSFLRSDAADEMTASSTSPILSIIQNGVGKVLALFSGVTEIFSVLSNGNVGVGTTTPSSTFAVDGNTTLDGNLTITGGLYDNSNATGTAGDILVSTGNGIEWNATSTLGLGNGTFLGLTDTPASYTANQVFFTNGAGNAITANDNLLFNGTNLAVGTTTLSSRLTVDGDIAFWGIQTTGEPIFAGEVWEDRNTESGVGSEVMYDADIGPSGEMIAVASGGVVVTSTDGGETWTNRTTAAGAGSNSLFASAIGPSGEMIVGGTSGYIRTSTDGGASWTNRTSAAGSGSTAVRGLAIGPSGEMLAVGSSGYVRTSVDGGASWTNRATAAGSGSNTLYTAAIGPSGEMVIGGSSGFFRISTDGGASWTNRSTEAGTSGIVINEADFGPDGTIIAVGSSGYVRTSIDGGASWTNRNTAAGAGTTALEDAAIGPDGEMIVVGSSGFVRISTDDGASWTNRNTESGAGSSSLLGTDIGPDGEMIVVGSLGFIITSFDGVLDTDELIPYLASNNGSVGVGTTTPSAKLDVWGDFKVGTSSVPLLYANTASQLLGIGTSTGTSKFTVQGTAGSNIVTISSSAGTSLMTVTEAGNVGIGTTTPSSLLSVAGNTYIGGELSIAGALRDGLSASGTSGMVLQTTGTSTRWVATSTLGYATTFLGLTDTPSSFAANRIMFTNSGATALTDSATFVFDGTNLGIGTSTPNNRIQVLDLIEFNDTDFVTQLGYQAGQNIVTGAQWNTFVGYQAGFASSTASTNGADNNTGIGYRTLYSNTSGFRNTAVGISALQNNTSGSNNTANGASALLSNTTGASNSAFGSSALQSNTTGYFNTGIGVGALQSNTTGYQNTAVGLNALTANTTGLDNTAVGVYTLQSNTTGSQNVAFGRGTLQNNTTASNNTAFGFRALATVTVGGSNTAIGAAALESNLTGLNNTAVGFQAGFDINTATSTGDNTLIGYNTGRGIVTGVNNTILGANVTGLSSSLSNNIIIADGQGNRRINVDSNGNVGIGTTTPTSRLSVVGDAYITGALRDGLNASGTSGMVLQTTGTSTRWVATSTLGYATSLFTDGGATTYLTSVGDNLAIGTTTATSRLTVDGSMNVTGNIDIPSTTAGGVSGVLSVSGERFLHGYTLDNTFGTNQFVGYQSGNFTLGSSTNSFIGIQNLGVGAFTLSSLTTGSANTAIGQSSLASLTDAYGNTAVGNLSLWQNTTGDSNTAVGESALIQNTTGQRNSAVGASSLAANTIGASNSAFGFSALGSNQEGNENVAIGNNALGAVVTGGNNTAVGYFALLTATSSNNTAVGSYTGSDITSGEGNTMVGNYTGLGVTTGSYNTILGASVTGLSPTLSNNIIIADGQGNRRINVDSNGNVGFGTTTPTSRLSVVGDAYITGALRDGLNASGTSGMVLQTTGTSTRWVATSTLGYATSLFTDGGATTYLTSVGDNLAIGTTTATSRLTVDGDVAVFGGVDLALDEAYMIGGTSILRRYDSPFINYTNLFVGSEAASIDTATAYANTAVGYWTLRNLTIGQNNSALGTFALANLTTGGSNTAVGDSALNALTIGGGNSALGLSAGTALASGDGNSFFGSQAGLNLATSSESVVIGGGAAAGNAAYEANRLTIIGSGAGENLTTGGDNNVIFGYQAGINVSTGVGNLLLGYDVADNLTTGSNNIIIGTDVRAPLATGNNQLNIGNLIFGTNVDGFDDTLSSGNIGIGTTTPSARLTVAGDAYITGALRDGLNASGTSGMVLQTTGTSTRWVATSTLGFSSGGGSLFTDGGAVTYLTDTADNLAIGTTTAGSKLTVDGDLRVYGGINFGSNNIISYVNSNISFGGFALPGATNNDVYANVAIGNIAGNGLGLGWSNVFLGNGAGTLIATGSRSVIIGNEAAGGDFGTMDGGEMVLIGDGAGYNLQSGGSSGVFVGFRAGENVTTGGGNTLLGYRAGDNITDGYGNIVIGYDLEAQSASQFQTLNIGNLIFGTGIDGSGTTLSTGNIGIGTSTPGSKLTVVGDAYITGALRDGLNASGTQGMVLQSTGTSTRWVATSTLGITGGGGATTFLALTDTISSFTANRILYTSGSAVVDSANFTYDGTDLGLGADNGIAINGTRVLTASTTANNYVFGRLAGLDFTSGAANVLIGTEAGRRITTGTGNVLIGGTFNGSSITTGGENTFVGSRVGSNLTTGGVNTFMGADTAFEFASGNDNAFFGAYAGSRLATSSESVLIGRAAGQGPTAYEANRLTILGSYAGESLATGADNNILIGYQAANNLTTGANNLVIGYDVDAPSATANNQLNIGNIIFGTGIDGTGTTLSTGNIGIGTSTPGSKLTVVGDAYITGALRDGLNASGTQGMVLQSTGTSTRWVATSTLGITGGSGGSLFTDGGAVTYLTDTADNLAIGTTTAGSKLTVDGDLRVYGGINFGAETIISHSDSNALFGSFALGNNVDGYRTIAIGDLAGNSFNTGFANVFIGNDAANNLSTTSGSVVIGDLAVGANYGGTSGGDMVVIGTRAGYRIESGGTNGVMIGSFAGENVTTGGGNILLGYRAGDNITDGYGNIVIGYDLDMQSASDFQKLNIGNLLFGTGIDGTGTTLSTGNIGIGTTTPESRLAVERLNFTGAGTAGLSQYIRSTNSTLDATQYGSQLYMYASNTATSTLIGSITRVADNTTFGNTTRGLEIQADNGNNTLGENTGLAAFARTFGVRGTTVGNAGGVFEPAGVFGETEGTTQGNAIRGYSSSITTAALLKLFQDTSTFTGTGLLMNFGNAGGSFSSTTASRFIDLQNAGSSRFTVGSYGMTTIGNGTTVNNAGLQIGYGGICVDNDGSCVASTTGRITAVSYTTANSDLAETYFSSDDLKTGEVVSLKGELSIERADEDNKDMVLGVVTTKPGLLLGSDDSSLTAGEDVYGVALSGRVPVRLSNENGDIKAGDKLMLSSVPGVAMKASSTGMVVGIALEDFTDTRAYSDTYINQFGDDLIDPIYVPVNSSNDPRINDGCYYGAGNAAGEAECVPLVGTTTDAQVLEAEALAAAEAQAEALEALKYVQSERVTLENGEQVRVGQIVMFVSLEERYLDEDGVAMVAALLAAAPGADEAEEGEETETIWSRLVTLASNFVDGVLSVFTLKADRVEVQDEICVDGVCLNADDLRQLLDANATGEVTPEEEPEENPEPETPVEEPEEVVEEVTPEEDFSETPTEPEGGEETEEVVPEEVEEEVPPTEPETEVVEEEVEEEVVEEEEQPETTPEAPVEETP